MRSILRGAICSGISLRIGQDCRGRGWSGWVEFGRSYLTSGVNTVFSVGVLLVGNATLLASGELGALEGAFF